MCACHATVKQHLSALLALLLSAAVASGAQADQRAPVSPGHTSAASATGLAAPAQQPAQRPRLVFKERITPHWLEDSNRFWYRNDLRGGAKQFILVDARRGTRQDAFDHLRLAEVLSQTSGRPVDAAKLPFDAIALVDEGAALAFRADGTTWLCDLDSYELSQTDREIQFPQPENRTGGFRGRGARGRRGAGAGPGSAASTSPDGKWAAEIRDHNIYLRPSDAAAEEVQLSEDGSETEAYRQASWSPDSQTLVAFRVEPGDQKEVHLLQSSPAEGGRARLSSRPYALPGDALPRYELNVFDVQQSKQLKPPVERVELGFGAPRVRWILGGTHFAYAQVDRGHQRLRVIAVEARSGAHYNIINEQTDTFLWTAHTENVALQMVNWLEQTDEIIYASERDGWRHLYLVDVRRGEVKNQITQGPFVVRGIERVDEEARQIWFTASGRNADQDPYFIHHYRIGFDGTGLVALTEGDGTHTVQYSPDRQFLIDSYSRVDEAPIHQLRRASDGSLVCQLETADIGDLVQSGWQPLEPFVAKGRDGVTDIWGVICRPADFDPEKKYPVIESIYAGPQGSFVPKSFSAQRRYASLADLGFIVVQIDGMGTANRSKAFHDVCWKNLGDAGLPDRILWMQAAAARYPYMDLQRVGVYGTSAGGQNAAGAVLFHPEFYKVAVAACGCHDNRMDKASWNEQWMGYMPPEKLWSKDAENWYARSSNIDNAYRLRGKLLLIVGEMDNNVPPESTMRLVDALIKANKDFDLLVVPNSGHGMGGSYGQRRMHDFFVRHLSDRPPPDRNAAE